MPLYRPRRQAAETDSVEINTKVSQFRKKNLAAFTRPLSSKKWYEKSDTISLITRPWSIFNKNVTLNRPT